LPTYALGYCLLAELNDQKLINQASFSHVLCEKMLNN